MSRKVYSVDILVCATAYIVAASEAEAVAKAKAFTPGNITDLANPAEGDVPISGAQLDSDILPEISLSPAMTFWGAAATLQGDRARAVEAEDVALADDGPPASGPRPITTAGDIRPGDRMDLEHDAHAHPLMSDSDRIAAECEFYRVVAVERHGEVVHIGWEGLFGLAAYAAADAVVGERDMDEPAFEARFVGQAWINDHAMEVDDGRFTYEVTWTDIEAAGGMNAAGGPERGDWDGLKAAAAAPVEVGDWTGPFEITLTSLYDQG